MSGNGADAAEPPDPDLVEAFAKQLFRAENPPDTLWDTMLFDRMGRSTEGMSIAEEAAKDDFRRRARHMLLNPQS